MSFPSPATHPAVNLAPQEVTFGDARGGRKPKGLLSIEVVRALEPSDIQALAGAVAAPGQRLLQLRHSHHQLAQLICEGRELGEISLMTGYAPAYISNIQNNDPAFQELLGYYATQREQVFVDTLERLKTLGLNSTEEILSRLESHPDKFTNRELMELAELALVKPVAAANAGRGGVSLSAGQGGEIKVTFVAAGSQEQVPAPAPLDITPTRKAAP